MRGLHVPRGLPFVLPYLPFLIVFGIAPTVYALDLAFTNAGGGWVGFHNFVRTYDDFRFAPGVQAHLPLHGRLARRADGVRRRPRPAPARTGRTGVVDVPLPLLHAGRPGRSRGGRDLAVHARPHRQPGVVPAARRVRGAHLRPVDRPRKPALHLRHDRVLDRRRRLDRGDVRRAEHDPARPRGGGAHRRRRPLHDRVPPEAPADPQVDRLHADPLVRDGHAALCRASARATGELRSRPRHLVGEPARLPAGVPVRGLQRGRRHRRRPARDRARRRRADRHPLAASSGRTSDADSPARARAAARRPRGSSPSSSSRPSSGWSSRRRRPTQRSSRAARSRSGASGTSGTPGSTWTRSAATSTGAGSPTRSSTR